MQEDYLLVPHFIEGRIMATYFRDILLLSVGLPVANAPDVLQPCTNLDVQTLTTSRLPKRSWQSEVELNLIRFRGSNFHH